MSQNKLITLFKLLKPDEFRMFYKFVRSIYYQNNTNLVSLYEYLRKYYPDFPVDKVKGEIIFKKLFPGRMFSQNKIATLMSKMTRLVEEYLLILDMREDHFGRKKKLVQIYKKRNQFDFFKKGTYKLLKELKESPFPNTQDQITLYHNLYFHPLHNKYDLEDNALENLMDSLDHYFVLTKMRYGLALKNKHKILSKSYEWKFIEVFAKNQVYKDRDTPVWFTLYEFAFSLLEEKAPSNFNVFEQLFFEYFEQLAKEDRQLLYFNGLNHLNRQVNKGKTNCSSLAFKWYKYGLRNNLLIENQQIAETTFSNIVVYGCREKEFNWTRTFMDTFKVYLTLEIREDIYCYNTALLHFSKKEFEETLGLMSNHSFTEKNQPKTRLTIIRTLFELFLQDNDYLEVLNANIQSFEIFISRNTFFEKNTLKPYLNCIQIIRGLTKRFSAKEDITKIRAWLNNQTQSKMEIIAINWLIQKVN